MFDIIDLAKTKIVDPTVFGGTFLPRRIWSRAFLLRGIFSSSCRQFVSIQVAAVSWYLYPRRYRLSSRASCYRVLLVKESFILLPWTADRHRSPMFVATREESPMRGSSAGGAPDRRLPSGPRPCNYAKFSPSIAKLPKLQNTNTKLLNTSFS